MTKKRILTALITTAVFLSLLFIVGIVTKESSWKKMIFIAVGMFLINLLPDYIKDMSWSDVINRFKNKG